MNPKVDWPLQFNDEKLLSNHTCVETDMEIIKPLCFCKKKIRHMCFKRKNMKSLIYETIVNGKK